MSSQENSDKAVTSVGWKEKCIPTTETLQNIPWKKVGIATALGVTTAYVAAPVAISVLGFKGSGILGGSAAAKMMSSVAIANGGGVPASSIIAALQSAGVLGISTKTSVIIGSSVGGTILLTPGGSSKSTDKEIGDAKDLNGKAVMDNTEKDNKPVVNGGAYSALLSACNTTSDVISGTASGTYSAVKSAGDVTYNLLNHGGQALMSKSVEQSKGAEVKDDAECDSASLSAELLRCQAPFGTVRQTMLSRKKSKL